jgi:hypothetical protein
MNNSRRNGFKATAIILAVALVQISFQLSFAAPSSSSFPALPQGPLGRITVRGTSPISINGNNAASGDTVATGALVQTPSGTEATVDLGPLGSVEFAPATRARVDYVCPADRVGNPDPEMCQVNVTLFEGCVVTNYRQGTRHKIVDERQAKLAESDRDKEKNGGGVLRTCTKGAPAGAAAAEGVTWTPTKIGLLVAAIAAPTAAILFALADDNPSPSTP